MPVDPRPTVQEAADALYKIREAMPSLEEAMENLRANWPIFKAQLRAADLPLELEAIREEESRSPGSPPPA